MNELNEKLINYKWYGIGTGFTLVCVVVVPFLIGTYQHYQLYGTWAGLDSSKPLNAAAQSQIVRVVLMLMCVLFYFLSVMGFSFLIEFFLYKQQQINNLNHSWVTCLKDNRNKIGLTIQVLMSLLSLTGMVLFQMMYRHK